MALQVFISYKSEYRDFARAVKGQLNQWGFQTWLDVDNIQPGDYFRHKIQQGLDSSDVLLMVLTEEAQLSREVMSEVDYFLDVAKKPVVPLRHRECKPLYIFVSIQYIDFVTDQANGFVQLKQRLGELAASIPLPTPPTDDGIVSAQKPGAPASSASEADTSKRREANASSDLFGAIGGVIPEPEPAEAEEPYQELEESVQEEKQKKEALLDDVLSVTTPPKPITAASPPPSPVRPQPMTEQSQTPIPALPPAAPEMQPQRQQEYMPQPAALGRRKSNPSMPLIVVALGLAVAIFTIIASSTNPPSIDATLTSAYIASIATNSAAFTYVPVTITAGATTTLNAEQTRVAELTALHLQTPTSTPSPSIVDRLGGAPIAATLFGLIIVSLLAFVIFLMRYIRRSKPAAKPSNSMTNSDQSLLGGIQATNRESILNIGEKLWLKDETTPALKSGAILKHKDYPDYPLPPNANILDVFNDLNRELLILGAPRGGKTVLLHQLASKLITQARQDTTKAIPIVFDLSSWTAERKPLADWLVDELHQKYQVPKTTAQTWIEGEKLLLLLDGLDEVTEPYRDDCVDAINTYRQKYRTVDLAICSRVADYDALTSKLDLRGAVIIE